MKNKNLNEILSIANEVLDETNKIHSEIENNKTNNINEDFAGKYYNGKFNKNIFGL